MMASLFRHIVENGELPYLVCIVLSLAAYAAIRIHEITRKGNNRNQ